MAQKKIDPDIAAQMRKEGMSYDQIAQRFGVTKGRIYTVLAKIGKSSNYKKLPECKYNMGINCDEKDCGTCGWNPDVSKHRATERKAKMWLLREVMRFE